MATSAVRVVHTCAECGFRSTKWMGRCPSCGEWDTLREEPVTAQPGSRPSISSGQLLPYPEIREDQVSRIHTGDGEFDRALGGGVVAGSMILLGGEPGVGKSTLLLQIAEKLSNRGQRVLYVAGEESARQIKLRGDRLGVRGSNLYLVAETGLERILENSQELQPDLLIVDSIQTVQSTHIDSVAGSLSQVRECAARLLVFAKSTATPVFLIGHITKDGSLAGPKTLEHVVDVVLYFEGDRHQSHKIVRAVKNRFGPANELGIFEMTSRGLLAVENPSQMFLSERADEVSGSAVICTIEGSRPVLVEIQALVSQSNYSTARRMTTGVDRNRVSLLLAMLDKRLGLSLLGSDVYINVAGGLSLTEPAVDLALVAAILSSYQDRTLSPAVVFGEVGLAGEVRAVSFAHSRVREAQAMGFRQIVLPKGNIPLPEATDNVDLVAVSSISDYLRSLDRRAAKTIN